MLSLSLSLSRSLAFPRFLSLSLSLSLSLPRFSSVCEHAQDRRLTLQNRLLPQMLTLQKCCNCRGNSRSEPAPNRSGLHGSLRTGRQAELAHRAICSFAKLCHARNIYSERSRSAAPATKSAPDLAKELCLPRSLRLTL